MRDLAIVGVTGRMGQALLRALKEHSTLRLSGAVASSRSPRLGLDAAAEGEPTGIAITADLQEGIRGASVVVDFSSGATVSEHALGCVLAKVPMLVGATGFDASARTLLEQAAQQIPMLIAPNTSVGVGVMATLVANAAAGLGLSYDVEISEAHHRHKRDAPSGTALSLGQAVAAARGQQLRDVAAFDRVSGTPRAPGSIGFAVLRSGDIVGEHTVSFAADGERLEITHRATDRMTFARGALRAAEWLSTQRPGLYGMRDVLGL